MKVEDKYLQQFIVMLEFRDRFFVRANQDIDIGDNKTGSAKSIMPTFKKLLKHLKQQWKKELLEKIDELPVEDGAMGNLFISVKKETLKDIIKDL